MRALNSVDSVSVYDELTDDLQQLMKNDELIDSDLFAIVKHLSFVSIKQLQQYTRSRLLSCSADSINLLSCSADSIERV
jgi:hypothetical protein